MHYRDAILLAIVMISTAEADDSTGDQPLVPEGAIIGEIVLAKGQVFDLSNPKENKSIFRLANRWHIITKDRVIQQQLLFKSGDAYSARLLDESARILRKNIYLYDSTIKPLRVKDGVVDISVATRDVWSLGPDISFSRSGGENRSGIGLAESNLFGGGQSLRVKYEDDVDRSSTSVDFFDRNFGDSWVSTAFRFADKSDGDSSWLSVIRPFYALDARWAAGASALDDDRRTALYQLGDEAAEYQHERGFFTAFGGWSKGLRGSYVQRWTAGVVYDDNQFSEVLSPSLPSALPENRKLVYPFAKFTLVEDSFEVSKNRDQIGRTEDISMGTTFSASLGWSDESLGADRDALIYSTTFSRGLGSLQGHSLLLGATASGRVESGNIANSLIDINARYYLAQSDKHLFFATIHTTFGNNLDLDNPVELGGDTGIRGYPQRYQSGESKAVVTIEQRYFTDWYPFRLARVGMAVFADAGRVWGNNPLGGEPLGWLGDVGFGLRLAPTRNSARKMIHIDIAFPLNNNESIDSVQILFQSKRRF